MLLNSICNLPLKIRVRLNSILPNESSMNHHQSVIALMALKSAIDFFFSETRLKFLFNQTLVVLVGKRSICVCVNNEQCKLTGNV